MGWSPNKRHSNRIYIHQLTNEVGIKRQENRRLGQLPGKQRVRRSPYAKIQASPSVAALQAAFILRGVTDVMDLVHNAIGGNIPVAVFALVMFLIEVFALIRLRGIKN